MAAFLKELTSFYGTGEKNEDGQSLEEFLQDYDPHKYETPSCTTDAVIFSFENTLDASLEGLKVLMVKRGNHPNIGYWALPGGFANMRENLDDTAKRELEEETGVKGLRMEQLATYGDYNRDPRTRVITTAYMALVKENQVQVQAGDDAADAVWCDLELKRLEQNETEEEVRNRYRLLISSKSRDFQTETIVEEYQSKGLIVEQKYVVIESGMIAADHGAIIVQALVTLKKRL